MDIQKYIDWARENNGSVDIEIDKDGSKVWCYMYDIGSGEHITLGDAPPTHEHLIKKQITQAREELERLIREQGK